MKLYIACALVFASAVLSAPALKHNDEDCTTTKSVGHQHYKRKLVYQEVVVTVTVDATDADSTSYPTVISTNDSHHVDIPHSSILETLPVVDATRAFSTESADATSTIGGTILGDFEAPSQLFEDGVYDCSSFPQVQGLVALNYLGFGGWSGIQRPWSGGGGSQYETVNVCSEGSYCSYACQSGMSKTQWISNQPSSGESVGGLLCLNGKLYRTNTNTNYLCEWGVDSAMIENTLNKQVSICRTDYPGTENMVIPTIVGAGSTSPISVVDQSTYFTWKGLPTSAQYYVNYADISQENGCVWGDSSSGVGNWAPMGFGAGAAAGISYIALVPNPNNMGNAGFNVKIVPADSNLVVNGACYYENGLYYSSNDAGAVGTTTGCTAAVTSGRGKFVFY